MNIQLPQLLDRRTGIISETYLSGDALDLFLRENPEVIKIGLSTSGDYLHYILLNQNNIDFKTPKTSDIVYNPFLGRLGIGSDNPQATLDVDGDIKFNGNFTNLGISTFQGPVFFTNSVSLDRFVVGVATITKKLDIGIGGTVLTAIASTDPSIAGVATISYGNIGIGSTIPQQKLDIAGSIKINKNIFDSNNQEGSTGYFLSRDSEGITWIQVNPLEAQGILVYNDLSLVGAGQSFFGINLKTGDGLGITTDTIHAFVNPDNPNIADIYVNDYWSVGSNGSVYRNTNVGIANSNPQKKLDVTGTANITGDVTFTNTTASTTKDTGTLVITEGGLGVEGNINLGGSIRVGSPTQSTSKDTGALILENGGLGVEGNINLGGEFKVGVGGTVIITTGIGSVGIGSTLPSKGLDIGKQVLLQKALYDSNRNVGYKTEFYKTPRTVLGQVAVGATGEVISDRFFDAANLIRLNLDFIAAEAVGFITSTSYKNPAFVVPGISSCKDDIKDILKAITLDITKGGNSQSVGAGLSYYNGASLIHITGNDANGYSIKDATIVAITTAAQISQRVINNVLWLPKATTSTNVTSAEYNNTTGILVVTSAGHNLSENDGVELNGLQFICSSVNTITNYNVSAANYTNTTGILTVTTSTNHNFTVGISVTMSNLVFSCNSGGGLSTAYFPPEPGDNNGDPNYVFNVISIPTSNQFVVNVGTSTITHSYVNGGVVSISTIANFPSGNYGYVFEVVSIPSSTSFSVYTGISTLAHTYVSGGTAQINVSRPFDGQVVYLEDLYYTVGGVTVGSGGTGYTGNANITIGSPTEPWGITATAVAEVVNGTVVSTEMISNGRGYGSVAPIVTFSSPDVGINTATGTATLIPTYYVISKSTPISSGICTITVTDNVPYAVGIGSTVPVFKQSRVLASGHSLEYIGSGTNISSALPNQGGVTIQENEIDMRNGGLVVFTSTDQSGNFRIGDGVVINQQDGTISGSFYSKSLFSAMTPFILALGGD